MEEFALVPDETVLVELTPEEATLLFYLLGLIFAQPLTIDEINVLANGLFEIAQVLFVISAQRTLINDMIKAQQEKEAAEKEKKSGEEMAAEIKKLQDNIKDLQKQIDGLKKQGK